ncbi:RasGEF [Thoreauomyces humboldtii]|nr:RasGEF [Thoreauomyces humboldtii]
MNSVTADGIVPRRASADSTFGRSVDEMLPSPPAAIVRQRSSFAQSSSVNDLSKAWENVTLKRKAVLEDQGSRASWRNLTSISTSKAVRLPVGLASTGALIKDRAIKHIKTPSGGKYESEILDILDVPPKDLARQLTLMDSEVFRGVPRDELASIAWTGSDKLARAPQIVATTQNFNQVALWVAEQIVLAEKIKRRFQLVCHFIGVAKCCLDLNNFNGLRSITAGLQSTPVHRLERTWAMVSRREKAIFDKMCDLMSPLSNSDAYRRRLSEAKAPCVPYLGTWLGDLTFLNECIKKEREDPARAQQLHERQAQIDALLDDVARYQQSCTYPLEPVMPIQDAISSFQLTADVHKIEDDQYQRSRVVEPKKAAAGPRQQQQLQTAQQGQQQQQQQQQQPFSLLDFNIAYAGSTGVGGKGNTIKGIRNRIRGNSGSVKCEPVNTGLLELHLGASLDGSLQGSFADTSSTMLVLDGEKGSERLFQNQDMGEDNVRPGEHSRRPSARRASDAGQSRHVVSPGAPPTPATPLTTAQRIRGTAKLGAVAPLPGSPKSRKGTKGHRRSKSGSAVIGAQPSNPSMFGKETGVSDGSLSELLVSKAYAEDRECDEDEELEDLQHHSSLTSNGRPRRSPSDHLGSSGRSGLTDANASRESTLMRSAGPSVGRAEGIGVGSNTIITQPSSDSRRPLTSSGEKLSTAVSPPDVTILPESDEDVDNSDFVRQRKKTHAVRSVSAVNHSIDELSSNAADISCVTTDSSSSQPYPSTAITIMRNLGSSTDRGSPTGSVGSFGRKSPTRRPDDPGGPTTALSTTPPTTVLDSDPPQLPELPQMDRDADPVMQGLLGKKEELSDNGTKVPGRKWTQVWVEVHRSPPRMEFYKVSRGDLKNRSGWRVPQALTDVHRQQQSSPSNLQLQGQQGQRRSVYTPGRRSTLVNNITEKSSSAEDFPTTSSSPASSVATPASARDMPPSPLGSEYGGSGNGGRPRSPASPMSKHGAKKGIWHTMTGMGGSAASSVGSVSMIQQQQPRSRSDSAGSRQSRTSKSRAGSEESLIQTVALLRGGEKNTAVPALYKKRKAILRVFPGPGPRRTVLLRAETDAHMQDWIDALNSVASLIGS